MLGFLTSVFSGGVTGLLGVVFQRFFDYQKNKLDLKAKEIDYAHQREMRKEDREMMLLEYDHRIKLQDSVNEGKESEADSKAFSASFAMEPKQYSAGQKMTPAQGWVLVILDLLRGVIRPGLTVYLCIITTLMYLEAQALIQLYGLTFSNDQALSIHERITATVLYLTTTCVLWWFGTRNKGTQPGQKK